jgi:hypothetical protein
LPSARPADFTRKPAYNRHDFQEFVGRDRRKFAAQVAANPRFADPATLPEAKILALQEAYGEGMKIGRQEFLMQPGIKEKYPELFGAPTSEHVVSRDTKARGRLRIQQANQWGDEPANP